MNILVVSPYLPHPRSGHGGGEYVFGLLKHLSHDHNVTLVSFVDQHEGPFLEDIKNLNVSLHTVSRWKRDNKNILINAGLFFKRVGQLLLSILFWEPFIITRYRSFVMRGLIRNLTSEKQFDVVQIEFAQMGPYVNQVTCGKTFLRAHDVVYRPAFRSYMNSKNIVRKLVRYIELCRWYRYERNLVRRFDHVLTFTEQDASLLKRISSSPSVSCNPRGIDIPDIHPEYQRQPFSLIFLGALDLPSNADAALWLAGEIFPRVRAQIPAATLTIIGKNPSAALRSVIEGQPGITLTGYVKEIEPYLMSASIFVAPIRIGGGIKTKVLHAASWGIPVVTTPRGAEGIHGANSETVTVALTADGLAEGAVALMTDDTRSAEQARRARIMVEMNYGWPVAIKHLVELYS